MNKQLKKYSEKHTFAYQKTLSDKLRDIIAYWVSLESKKDYELDDRRLDYAVMSAGGNWRGLLYYHFNAVSDGSIKSRVKEIIDQSDEVFIDTKIRIHVDKYAAKYPKDDVMSFITGELVKLCPGMEDLLLKVDALPILANETVRIAMEHLKETYPGVTIAPWYDNQIGTKSYGAIFSFLNRHYLMKSSDLLCVSNMESRNPGFAIFENRKGSDNAIVLHDSLEQTKIGYSNIDKTQGIIDTVVKALRGEGEDAQSFDRMASRKDFDQTYGEAYKDLMEF